jgi:hypothetical protein
MNENRYAQFFALPERQQAIVDAGIPLMELTYLRKFDNAQKIFGFHNVRVREYADNGSFKIQHSIRWFTGEQAYLEFYPNKKSICTAFAPDDQEWHNRVMVALNLDSGLYTVAKIHTPNGVIPAQAAMQEMKILRDLIMEWKAFDGPQVVFRCKTRVGMQAFADDFLKKNGRAVDIVLGKTEPIERLTAAHGGRFMETSEFQTTVKVRALELITAAQANLPVSMAQIGQNVLTQVASMDESAKRELASMLLPYMAPPRTAHIETAATGSTREQDVEMLKTMTYADLKRLAKAKGLKPGSLNKEDLSTALMVKLDEERAADQPAPDSLPPPVPSFTQEEAGNPYDGVPADEEVAQ